MAVIHKTTMDPGKLDLLGAWLPTRPWYTAAGGPPELTVSGGFRLDDPRGAVGMEFMVVTDTSGVRPVAYHVPLTYRGAPLDGAPDTALLGTSEHGVLGRRWVYDGAHDPVLVAQVLAFLQGRTAAQDQNASDTPDPSVTAHFSGAAVAVEAAAPRVTDGEHGTEIAVGAALRLTIVRALHAGRAEPRSRGHVSATWRPPTGDPARAAFLVLQDAPA
ncbi:1,4-alpha-glucan branching protein [Streptomyces sp. TRM70308]|uniref:maltokinase N-terminal cap-like domain-containing protein n=1 Tax=Streptomyces sp. TRM70308 TaxID=3131932 RepID=UPI003D083655